MSWMQRLYETYGEAQKLTDLPSHQQLMPISHTLQNAHINIAIDADGQFLRARVLRKTQIVLPATEKSAGRSSDIAPHPLADKLQYVAQDYASFGDAKTEFFQKYKEQLEQWCQSGFSHPQASAVLTYITKGQVINDLVTHGILFANDNAKLITRWVDESKNPPDIFSVLPKEKGELDQGSALVCWTVERPGVAEADTWKDVSLQQSWLNYESANGALAGLCFITGVDVPLAVNHPAKLRHTGDKAKLISANDEKGFTFRGKFLEKTQAAGISFEVTQKAHNALRWLISRQGYKNGDQVTIAWAISGAFTPNPMQDPFDMVNEDDFDLNALSTDLSEDLGQKSALKLKNLLKGYRQKLNDSDQLSLMMLDSATPGRMAIAYYKESLPDEYFDALNDWYDNFAWYMRHSQEIPQDGKKPKSRTIWPALSPSPYAIAQTAYGQTLSDTLKKQVYARLLPCIAEKQALPEDILKLCITGASNPNSGEHWEWERNVGVACALYKGFYSRHQNHNLRRTYTMALDENYSSRDYLYGRLLAIAEQIERIALSVANEKRPTNAERFMQKFAERPYTTWRNLELALAPYRERLRNNRAGFLINREKELGQVMNMFKIADFTDDTRLSGEFLLGYHSQKMAYTVKKTDEENDS